MILWEYIGFLMLRVVFLPFQEILVLRNLSQGINQSFMVSTRCRTEYRFYSNLNLSPFGNRRFLKVPNHCSNPVNSDLKDIAPTIEIVGPSLFHLKHVNGTLWSVLHKKWAIDFPLEKILKSFVSGIQSVRYRDC